jgi:hypothetical protein
MKLLTFKLVPILAIVFALSACQKEKAVTPVKNNTGEVTVDAKELVHDVNNLYANVTRIVEMVGDGSLTGKKASANALLMSCAVLTVDTISMPHTVDFDLGTGCTSEDGTFFSGHLRIEFTDYAIRKNGCRINAIATNWVQGATEYNGNLQIHNTGPNGSSNPEIVMSGTLNMYDHSISQPVNATMNLTHEWVSGSLTEDVEDDALSVTGGITGDNGGGTNFNVNINDPLIISYSSSCVPVYNKGQYTYAVGIDPVETFYYGDGTCDDIGYHIVNGDTTEFTVD